MFSEFTLFTNGIIPLISNGIASVIGLSALYAYWNYMSWKGLPPGPIGFPLLGYLPWMDAKNPHISLTNLVKTYGKIFSLRLGTVKVIVLADASLVKKAFSMPETTVRAPLYLTHGIMRGYGLVCSEGALWKEHRKFVLGFMRDMGMKNTSSRDGMEAKILQVASSACKDLEASAGDVAGVDIGACLLDHVGNTLNQLIFGVTYEPQDTTWIWLKSLLEEGMKFVGVAGPLNFLPWLRFLPKYKNIIKYIKENQVKTHEAYQEIIDECEKQMEVQNLTFEKKPVTTFVEAYLQERLLRNPDFESFTYDQLYHVAADLFGAGTETSLTTLKWHLIDLALHPDVQDEVYKELMEVSKDSNKVAMSDLKSLKRTQAAIWETQRLRSIIPLGVPHGVEKDIILEGYKIPRGAMLLPLQWSIHRDPDVWNSPNQYRPQRFLDENEDLIRHPHFIPFQTGRRVCIGDDFAKMTLLIFTSQILLKFKISTRRICSHGTTNDCSAACLEDPTEDPVVGITLAPKPFNLVLEKRNP